MKIRTHQDLDVYKLAFKSSMEIYDLTKGFPKQEMYSLTDQIRRSSRSVCANLAEAFRKRKYPKAFTAKLSDCEGESAETQTWLDYCLECEYIEESDHARLQACYDKIIRQLVAMAMHPERWTY
jgi:four helix bundle protein